MTILKRGNSKYWYMQFQSNGRTYIRSSRSTIRKVAEQMESEWRSKLHAQEFLGHRDRLVLRDALSTFCESKRGTPNYPTLIANQKVALRLLPTARYCEQLTSHDLERFKQARLREGVMPQTIKHGINLVRGALKYASKLGFLVGQVEYPEVRMQRAATRFLSSEEEVRLLCELDPLREGNGLAKSAHRSDELLRNMQDCYDLVILLLDTGARYSEIANIEWTRIDLINRVIHLWRPKVQNESLLLMSERVNAVLTRRASAKGARYVFSNRQGGPRGYASQAIRKAMKKAGLDGCHVHTLRHTHASRLIQNGMSVYEVRELLGHSDIKTTMRYAHLESQAATLRARDVMNKLNGVVT